jgi:hypothetical protein
MIVAEKTIIRSLVSKIKKTYSYKDGGTWFDEACNILKLKYYLHSLFEKSMIERVNHYLKDGMESFDDYWISYIISIEDNNGDSSSYDHYDITEVY